MTTYFSTKRLFAYTITNTTSYVLDSNDFSILESVFNRWDELITPDSRFEGVEYTIEVAIRIETLALGILGGASIANVYYFGDLPLRFGHMFPATGNITLNYLYISGLKNSLREGGKSEYYYVMLHEVGHILGIGPFWAYSGAPIVSYLDDGITKYYYTGVNALREYKSYFSPMASMLVGIPIEDDGGSGTAFVHPEEGTESYLSSDTRMINGVWHPGLDTELMTGWLDAGPAATPLSRITLGFLEDMGYGVNYNLADYYRVMSEWLDLSYASNCFKHTYVQGFLDISGGSITTRGTENGLVIGGDSSLNGTVYLGDSMYIRSNGLFPGTADNGATPVYVDVSGGPDVAGSIAKPDLLGGPDVAGSILSVSLSSDASWSQLGFDIDGERAGDKSGHSVSMINSATYGRVVAIGANFNDGTTTTTSDNRGHVRVYQHRTIAESDWTNYNITDASYNGIAPYDKLIVVGASGDATPVSGKKYWVQLGFDIDGELAGNQSGHSVSLVDSNADGLVVAIGANLNAGNGSSSGHVRVYQYRQYTDADANIYHHTSQTSTTKPLIITANNTAPVAGTFYWTQIGFDIDGEAAQDRSGQSVSLVDSSANGLVVAIGATSNAGNGSDSGHVRVYQYRQYTSADANIYHHTSRTSTTKPLIITANNTTPLAGTSYWTQIGFDIDGEASSNQSGYSISLVNSANGLVVAIGAPYNGGNGSFSGHVRVYQYRQYTSADANIYHHTSRTSTTQPLIITANNTTPLAGTSYWTQIGFDIDGEAANDQSGVSVSLVDSNANGLVVAIGARNNDAGNATTDNRGHVRVYQYRQYTSADADANIYHHASRLQDTTQTKPLIITANNTTPLAGTSYWTQIGFDIDGELASDRSGQTVSLVDSANGLVVAIGAINNDAGNATSDNRGHVRVYQYRQYTDADANKYHHTSRLQDTTQTKPLIITASNTTEPDPGTSYWTQTGFDIDGEAGGDNSGHSVSLVDSADGLVVAIGAYLNDAGNATSDDRGHVRVYEIPYTKTYSDVSGGFFDVSVLDGYLNDGRTTAALYVNGDTDLSGGLTVSGDVSFNSGNLFVAGDLSLNGNLFINSFAPNSIGADAIDSTVNINFANKLSVSVADLSFNTTGIQVATNFNSNNTPIALAANLTVPANIAIVDGSNGTVYGSYLTLTNKAATAYYNVGKSASGLFNIVDQANAGVYLTAGGTSFTGTSDARLKTNISPLESATDKIMALNPCTYQWKSDIENTKASTKTHIGFIAQEVEQIMPELVHPIDHPAGPDYKGVNTTDLIPYLVRTIQEQKERIRYLSREISELEAGKP